MSLFDDLMADRTLAQIRQTVIEAASVVELFLDRLPPLSILRSLALDKIPKAIQAASAAHGPAIRGGLKDFATRGWLTLLAAQVYNVLRIELTFVTVPVTLTNSGPDPYSFAAQEVRVGNAVTKKVYANVSAFSLDAFGGPDDEVTADFIALEPGAASNADAGDITEMVTTFGGVTCINATVGAASDEETDEAIRARCTFALGALSPDGAADGYRFIATSAMRMPDGSYGIILASDPPVPGAVSVGIIKVQVLEHVPDMGDVTVYLADADGAPAGADVTGVHGLILKYTRAIGVAYIDTLPVTTLTVDITYDAAARASDGFTTPELEDMAQASLIELFASLRDNPIGGIGGLFFRSAIHDAIMSARPTPEDPRPFVDVPFAALIPAADVAVAAGELPVLGTVTANITLI